MIETIRIARSYLLPLIAKTKNGINEISDTPEHNQSIPSVKLTEFDSAQ